MSEELKEIEVKKMNHPQLTAFQAAAALGQSKSRTPANITRAMVRSAHGLEKENNNAFYKQYIENNMPMAFAEYMASAPDIPKRGEWVKSNSYPWLTANPSGVFSTGDTVEIMLPLGQRNKSREELTFKPAIENPDFYARIQLGLLLTGGTSCDAYQWAPNGDFLEVVEFDSVWISDNLPKLRLFYQQVISEMENTAHLRPLVPAIETPIAISLVEEFQRLKAIIEDAEARKAEIMEELVEISGGEAAIIAGKKLTRVIRSGAVQYAKIVKEHLPDLSLNEYTGSPSEYWQLK